MDDITSADTIGEAKKLCKDIDGILDLGGFKIKEWVVTGEGATINDGFEKVTGIGGKQYEDISEKILGMEWDANKDVFIFRTKIRSTEKDENGYKD